MRPARERCHVFHGMPVFLERHHAGAGARAIARGAFGFVVIAHAVDEALASRIVGELWARFEIGNDCFGREPAIRRRGRGRVVVPGLQKRRRLQAVGTRVVLFHVHIGGALEVGALHHLRHRVELVEQPAQEQCARAGAGRTERALGLHPDFTGAGGRQVIAETVREKSLAVGENEFAGLAEPLDRSTNFLGLRHRKIGRAETQERAFDPRIASGRIERQHDVHDRRRPRARVQRIGRVGICDRRTQIEVQDHLRRQPVAFHHPDARENGDQENDCEREFEKPVECPDNDRLGPAQKRNHMRFPFARTVTRTAAGRSAPRPYMGSSLKKANRPARAAVARNRSTSNRLKLLIFPCDGKSTVTIFSRDARGHGKLERRHSDLCNDPQRIHLSAL